MDFYEIRERSIKRGVTEVYPDFIVKRSHDLMVRGKAFYAIWDEDAGLWSTDEYDVMRLVDRELNEYRSKMTTDDKVIVRTMNSFSSKAWVEFKKYMNSISDNVVPLDNKITFANTVTKKKDYVSKKLPYSMEPGSIKAYDELISKLYSPDERRKIEWAIGAVISGDAKKIQKFMEIGRASCRERVSLAV